MEVEVLVVVMGVRGRRRGGRLPCRGRAGRPGAAVVHRGRRPIPREWRRWIGGRIWWRRWRWWWRWIRGMAAPCLLGHETPWHGGCRVSQRGPAGARHSGAGHGGNTGGVTHTHTDTHRRPRSPRHTVAPPFTRCLLYPSSDAAGRYLYLPDVSAPFPWLLRLRTAAYSGFVVNLRSLDLKIL